MALSPVKKISDIDQEICTLCGNCARCPYMAIKFNGQSHLCTDPALCIGCSICSKKCFVGAITMRERTEKELSMLQEH